MEILSQNGAAFNEIRSQISTNHEDTDKGSAKGVNAQPQSNSLETKDNSIYAQGANETDLPTTDTFEARTDRVSTSLHAELNAQKNEMTPLEEKQQELADKAQAVAEKTENTKFQEQLLAKKADNAYKSQSKVAQWNYNSIFKS